MLKTNYDNDVTIWNPQGRLFQVEYASEAVKNGTITLALKSKTHVVFCALKSVNATVSAYKTKISQIDPSIGVSVSGLMADARFLIKKMHETCLKSRQETERQMQIGRLVTELAVNSQKKTQQYGSRPYGLGMIVGGIDSTGTHVYEFNPQSFKEYSAVAIGARSQSAKTYLEKKHKEFENASLEELIIHGVNSLKKSICAEENSQKIENRELNQMNTSIAYVDSNGFKLLDETETKKWLDSCKGE